jgi:hypothetical protein
MQIVKKIFLNPWIWVDNNIRYLAHLESQKMGGPCQPYDWSQDKKYY